MTTLTPSDGAPDSGGAVDPFAGLPKLLPKLVQPSWYKHVHSGMYHETRHRHVALEDTTAAVAKAKRRNVRKASRLARALGGERTRVTRVAA